ncbi:MAG: SDR family NAD(P)-dependent oxidoreductase [Calditrichaeota bacterium]|nr:SDR family NAD(P)-dependent oxidoreductase [Calditrichota bacterium]
MKTALVTGATGAIGKSIARQLAEHGDFKVVLTARDEKKAQKVTEEIIRQTGNKNVRYVMVDLSLKSAIRDFVKSWKDPLHVLINNAAVTPRQRIESAQGIELQFATNVLAYLWLTNELLEFLKQGAPTRVVNVASYYAGNLDLNDLEFKKRRYDNNSAYRQSKQANRMLTVAQAEKLKSFNITVNSCHPGDVNSQLSNNLGFGGSTPADKGAETPVWLATNPALEGVTGKFFSHEREADCQFSQDKAAIEKLYEICESY